MRDLPGADNVDRSRRAGTAQGPHMTELTSFTGTRHNSGRMAFSPDGKTIALPKAAKGASSSGIRDRKGTIRRKPIRQEGFAADRRRFLKRRSFFGIDFRPEVLPFAACKSKEQIRIPTSESNWFVGISFEKPAGNL